MLTGDVIAEFPEDLFFDPELIWHQQHFGRPGQIATANLVVRQDRLYSMVHISDLVQRISRRREHKTRIENRFQGWDQMLVNGVLAFAAERRLTTVLTPTADLAIRHTDPARSPARELFARVYDRHVQQRFEARRDGEWWALDVHANRGRVVLPERRVEPAPTGQGHLRVPRHRARARPCRRRSRTSPGAPDITGAGGPARDAGRRGRGRDPRDVQRGRGVPARGTGDDRGGRARRRLPFLRSPDRVSAPDHPDAGPLTPRPRRRPRRPAGAMPGRWTIASVGTARRSRTSRPS